MFAVLAPSLSHLLMPATALEGAGCRQRKDLAFTIVCARREEVGASTGEQKTSECLGLDPAVAEWKRREVHAF